MVVGMTTFNLRFVRRLAAGADRDMKYALSIAGGVPGLEDGAEHPHQAVAETRPHGPAGRPEPRSDARRPMTRAARDEAVPGGVVLVDGGQRGARASGDLAQLHRLVAVALPGMSTTISSTRSRLSAVAALDADHDLLNPCPPMSNQVTVPQ